MGNYKEIQYSSHSGWMYGQDTYTSADKSKNGCKNVLGVVMEVTDDDYYKIWTKNGIINKYLVLQKSNWS